ncbi:acyltransferase family protein [Kocuria marina]|uniref:acyltransferase family protein n=1 Tax=Kocuria marina TaxID=223184 RepID=UPI0021B3B540|nr:acyltransferase family protein [Kocuria indica]
MLPPDRTPTLSPAPCSPTTAPAPWSDVSSAGAPTDSASPGSSDSAARVARFSGFRPEVQGLRAIAVLLVVVYHVFMGRVSGGVDVFLFISAFFMTLSFVRKLEGGRPLALGRYWLHTFKRLLPLATVVILATLFLVWWLYPAQDVADFRFQGVASILYFENWTLAFNAVDYYAADHSSASPFQHFWSLSVQGQVFLLWPLIFGLAWLDKRRTGHSSVPVLAACFGLVFAASLAFSVLSTATHQEFAYFDTRARLWEFALGSLVALAIPYVKLPRAVRLVLGWGGLVSMVSVGILVDVQGAFPGWIALWPLLSAAAIIVAGQSGSALGLDRFLSWAPVMKLGDAAYALYLVHWPLLVTYLVVRDRPVAGPRSGVVIVVVSVLLALLLTKIVENPLKRWKWPEAKNWRLALVIAVCLGLVVVPARTWSGVEAKKQAQIESQAFRNNPGATVLTLDDLEEGDPNAPLLPVIEGAYPRPSLGGSCPEEMGLKKQNQMWCGVTVESPNASNTVLVVGNSHALQWIPALQNVAEDQDWNMTSYVRGNCFIGVEEPQVRDAAECESWLEDLDKVMDSVEPDIVVINGTRSTEEGGETLSSQTVERMHYFTDRGSQVVAIRDNPRFDYAPGVCLEGDAERAADCMPPKTSIVGQPDPLGEVAAREPAITEVDMNDLICPDGTCSPVIGNLIVYWDNNHITPNYIRSMSSMLLERVTAGLAEDGF